MRETLEMYTASRMQHMVQIRKINAYSVTILLLKTNSFGALGVESAHGGAIKGLCC